MLLTSVSSATNVELLADGRFETKFWKIGAVAAQSANFVALHENKKSLSYMQGKIDEIRPVEYQNQERIAFIVSPTPDAVEWEGAGAGAGEKGYGY